MYRSICFVLTFAVLAAPAAAQQHVVDAVNATNPQYLAINDHAHDAKFLQCVVLVIRGAGYLSKSPGENGFTWPNGVRTSHDTIAFADGSRVDVIGASDNLGVPARPTWNPIPPHEWRPSNVFVPASAVPKIAACDGSEPIEPPPPPPPDDFRAVLEAIADLKARVDAIEGTLNGFGDSIVPALQRLEEELSRTFAAADSAQKQAAAAAVNTEKLLEAQPTAVDFPEYRGRFLGLPVVLRPQK